MVSAIASTAPRRDSTSFHRGFLRCKQVRFELPVSAFASTTLRRDSTSCRRGRESSPCPSSKKENPPAVDSLFWYSVLDGLRTLDWAG